MLHEFDVTNFFQAEHLTKQEYIVLRKGSLEGSHHMILRPSVGLKTNDIESDDISE